LLAFVTVLSSFSNANRRLADHIITFLQENQYILELFTVVMQKWLPRNISLQRGEAAGRYMIHDKPWSSANPG